MPGHSGVRRTRASSRCSTRAVSYTHLFYGISANGKQRDQDIYSGATLENRVAGNWHTLIRYGIARKREQAKQFTSVGMPISYDDETFGPCTPSSTGCFTEYFGNVMTIRGANGYTATGQASFFVPTEDTDSNSDELYYQSDYSLSLIHISCVAPIQSRRTPSRWPSQARALWPRRSGIPWPPCR